MQHPPLPPILLKIYFNIILPSMPRFSKWSLSLNFPHQNPVRTLSSALYVLYCYMPRQSHFPSFHHPSNIWCWLQVMKLFIMQSSPFPCYLVPLRSKYIPQRSILKHSQPLFLPHFERPSSTPIHKNRQNYSCVSSSLYCWIANDRVVAGILILLLTSSAMQFWFVSIIISAWFRVEYWKWLTKCLCHMMNKPSFTQTYFERT